MRLRRILLIPVMAPTLALLTGCFPFFVLGRGKQQVVVDLPASAPASCTR